MFLCHENGGATEGYDPGFDTLYSGCPPEFEPVVDFFSMLSGHTVTFLWEDVRDAASTSTFHTRMLGKDLAGLAEGNLSFQISGVTDFAGLPIYADVYKNGTLVQGDIDVRKYATDGTTVPLSLSNDADYYNIDVRFTATPEPSSLTLLGIGAIGFGWWRRRRSGICAV